jgi:hypothetical protein
MAPRGSDLPGITTVNILERMIEGYEAAFTPEARGETTDSSDDMPKTVKLVMRQAAGVHGSILRMNGSRAPSQSFLSGSAFGC